MPRARSATSGGTAGHRSENERKFVLVLCGVFGGIVLALSGMEAHSMMARARSRDNLTSSLEKVSKSQSEFRARTGHFATWSQLEANGRQLQPGFQVVRSSATESHWYIQLYDPDTGLVCDRIHELRIDGDDAPGASTCRKAFTK